MKNIIVSGASGFIGKALVKRMLQEGNRVCAIVTSKEKMQDVKSDLLTVVTADFSTYLQLPSLIEKDVYDCFYHLAWTGYGKTTNDYTVQLENVKATCDAVKVASAIGCKRIVFASSFSEYMIPDGSDISHNDNGVCNVYGATKESARLMAQAVAYQNNISMVSVAFSNTFGPGDYSRRTPNLFLSKFMQGQDVDLTPGDALYEWTYIDDSVEGLICAAEKGKDNGIYYIGSNNVRPLKDIVGEIRDLISPESKINLGKYKENFKCDYNSIDTFRLTKDTGYQPKCEFKNAILSTVAWLKEIDFK